MVKAMKWSLPRYIVCHDLYDGILKPPVPAQIRDKGVMCWHTCDEEVGAHRCPYIVRRDEEKYD